MNTAKSLFYATVTYAFYIELSPGMGNIWYRTGIDGLKHIKLNNLLNIMINPLISCDLWNPRLWDTNYFIFITLWFLVKRIGVAINTSISNKNT